MATNEQASDGAAFEAFIAQAWADHAEQAVVVAERLRTLTPTPRSPAHIGALARLVVHLLGEHLGQFDEAQRRLAALASHPLARDEAAAADLRVARGALRLALNDDAGAAPASVERARTLAGAAAICVGRGRSERALALLDEARTVLASLPGATAAAHRPLAIACNNMAWALHERGDARSLAETGAMLDIAAASRHHWAIAGTWLEVERADYCLALTHLAAGRADDALRHAAQCLAACIGHEAPPYEHFHGHEALARIQHARGDAAARAHHVAAAQAAFERLDAGERGACRPPLIALRALGAAAP